MNVIGVNGINNINSNQGYKKNSQQQNFGQLVFTNAKARDTFARKIAENASASFQGGWKVVLAPHINSRISAKLITDGESTARLVDAEGRLIIETKLGRTQPVKRFLNLVADGLRELMPSPCEHEATEETASELVKKCSILGSQYQQA